MKIECDKLRSFHRYTHAAITDMLSRIIGINNTYNNTGIFYIYPVRNRLIIYIQISNYGIDQSKLDLLSTIAKISDNEEGSLGEAFKLELNQCVCQTREKDYLSKQIKLFYNRNRDHK